MNRRERAVVNGMLCVLRQWGAVEFFPSINRVDDHQILHERIPQARAVIVEDMALEASLVFCVLEDGTVIGKRLEYSGVYSQTTIMTLGRQS